MTTSKLIVVLGATGNQGGSVASTFLENGWRVRAVTRDPSSAKSKLLSDRGAEVVRADFDDPSTLEAAFQGSHVIFAVSDFWGLYNDPVNVDKPRKGQSLNQWAGETETKQLKNVIDVAAKISTLERFVLSSLSHVSKWSEGKYTHVYHFDSKALAEDHARETHQSLWAKTDTFQAGFFLSNFASIPMLAPKKDPSGKIRFELPLNADVKLPFIVAEEDSGPIVLSTIASSSPPGKTVIAYREWLTMDELAGKFSKVTGLEAEYVALPEGSLDPSLPVELAVEVAENLAYFNHYGYEGREDGRVVHSTELPDAPRLGSVEEYLAKQDWSRYSE